MIEHLPALQLREWLDDSARPAPLIVDVRDTWEYELCHIPGAQSLPLQEIPQRWSELPPQAAIVLVCYHGMRSLHAASFLQDVGFERLYSLSGGVAAWAQEIDPAMPQY